MTREKITNAVLFQKLEDNQLYLQKNMQELKNELTCLRDEFTKKHEERVASCGKYREELYKEINAIDRKADSIKAISLTISAVAGFIGGAIGALLAVVEYIKKFGGN